MKKIIAPICFTVTIILLVVLGIVFTESMLKADDDYKTLKDVVCTSLTDVKDISKGHTDNVVCGVYQGKYEKTPSYAFVTTDKNEYIEITMVVVISKNEGTVLEYVLTGQDVSTKESTLHTNGISSLLESDAHLNIVGINKYNQFSQIQGATVTCGSIKKCLKAAFEMYEKLLVESDPSLLVNSVLSKVGVTDGAKLDRTITSNNINAIYTGKLNDKDVYVFDGSAPNEFNGSHIINVLIVVDKATGEVLKTKVVGDFTYNYSVSATDFGMTGATSIESFKSVTSATLSSNSVKTIFTAVLAEYARIGGTK